MLFIVPCEFTLNLFQGTLPRSVRYVTIFKKPITYKK